MDPIALWLSAICAAAGLPGLSAAQTGYTFTISGGTATVDSGSHAYSYSAQTHTYGGTAVGTSASCSGTMTFSYTWPANAGPPPASVILQVQGDALFEGASGACDDGLGDSEDVNTTNGIENGTSVGAHYYVMTNPGQHWFYKVTPSASETYSPPNQGQCSVSMYIGVTDVTVTLGGTLATGGQYPNESLPGQYLTATISAGQYTLAGLSWNFSGSPEVVAYSNHDTNHTYQSWAGFTQQDLTSSPISFLPISAPGPDPEPCAAWTNAAAYDPYGISIGQVTGSAMANVRNPHGVLTLAAVGPSALLPDNLAGTPKILSSGTQSGGWGGVGMTMQFNSTTPSDFSAEAGYPGSVGYAQTLGFVWDEDGAYTSIPDIELDTVFPYSSGPSNYPGTYETTDTPQIGHGSNYLSATDLFLSFTIYLPPGASSTWVPTTGGKWNWASYAGYGSPTWYGPVGNAAVTSQNIPWPDDSFNWTKTFIAH